MPLTEDEIRALLNYPWQRDYSKLSDLEFWRTAVSLLPPVVAAEAKARLASLIGETASSLPVIHLDFQQLLMSSDLLLQRVLGRIGSRYLALAMHGLNASEKAKIINNVSSRISSDISRITAEIPEPSDVEVSDARQRILDPIEWEIRSSLEREQGPGQNGV